MDAWNISLNILNGGDTSGQVRFFAAQTLKHKIVADFVQLDERTIRFLKDTLLALVLGGERQVGQQLILGIAALAVQCPPSLWPNPVEDLVGNINGNATLRMLGILACIPEQMENRLINMSSAQNVLQRTRLIDANVDQVITLIGTLLPSAKMDLREQLLSCLLSWIKYGAAANPQLVGSPKLLESMLVTLLEDINQESYTLETSSEIICELFFKLFQTDEPPNESYLTVLFGGLVAILPKLGDLIHAENDDLILKTGRVFLEAGEAFLPLILTNQHAIKIILDAALMLAKCNDLKVVEATFSLWSALEMRLAEADEITKDLFFPVFSDLFRSLVTRHLAFPLDDTTMSAEERDSFRDFRHVIGDCLKDCTRVMGSTAALLIVKDFLRDFNSPWQKVEASLFALRTISASVDRRESEALPEIFRNLLQVHYDQQHPRLVYAIILNIGCYAEWARYHHEFVAPFLSYLVSGFKEHPAAAAMALKYLCQSCNTLLINHEAALRSLYCQCIANDIEERDMAELSESVANVLAVMTEDQISALLPQYLTPWLTLIDTKPGSVLDNLTIFVELIGIDGEDESATMNSFLAQLIPNLSNLLTYSVLGNEVVVESLTILIKTIIVHHVRFSPDLVDLLDLMYSEHSVISALYAFRYVVIGEPKIITWPRLQKSLHLMVETAGRIGGGGGNADFFHLIAAALDYYEETINDQAITKAIEIATGTLSMSPINPNDVTSTILFLLHLFQRLSSTTYPVHQDLSMRMSALLTSCIKASLQGAISLYPYPVLSDVAALFRKYHAYNPADWRELLAALLKALPESLFLSREKHVWMDRFEMAVLASRPREMKEALIAFVNACRRRL